MSKLFLTSLSISPSQSPVFAELVGKRPQDICLALIENAADTENNGNNAWVDEIRSSIASNGYKVEQVDLRNFKGRQDELHKKLQDFDAIWIGGGNTYYLRWILRVSGADVVIEQLVNRGMVYGGGSAGAIVAGPTTKHFEKADNPGDAPDLIHEGMALTDTVVVPHVGNEFFGDLMLEADLNLQNDGFKTAPIDDSQAFVQDGLQSYIF